MAPRGKDRHKRKCRTQTAAQKALQVQKTQTTKAKNKKAREAEEAAKKRAVGKSIWKRRFGIEDESSKGNDSNGKKNDNNSTTTEDYNKAQDMQIAEDEHYIVTIDNPSINEVISPAHVYANLDYNNEEETESHTVDDNDNNFLGIQEQYVLAIQEQIKSEVNKRKSSELSSTIALKEPAMPRPFHIPPPQALHAALYVQHGRMIIGNKPIPIRTSNRNWICTLCERNNNGLNALTCTGKGNWTHCKYFNKDNTRKTPILPKKTRVCRKCHIIGCRGVGGHKFCSNA